VQIETIQSSPDGSVLLLETDGSLWAWGRNWSGQVGDGTRANRLAPVQILDNVVSIAPDGSFAICADGGLWNWGVGLRENNNREGLRGALMGAFPFAPELVMEDVARIYQHDTRDYVIRTDSSLWALGPTRFTGHDIFGHAMLAMQPELEPVHILDSVVEVQLIHAFAYALQCNGRLWFISEDVATHLMDEVVAFFPPPSSRGHTFVLQSDGSLWSLPVDMGNGQLLPVHVMEDVASVHRMINGGDFILQPDGTLWAMGHNPSGQLGVGVWAYLSEPVHVMYGVGQIYPHHGNAFAVRSDGGMWAWGLNNMGQLGDGTTSTRQRPVHIMDDVSSLYFDFFNTFALGRDGRLWHWGVGLLSGAGIVEGGGVDTEVVYARHTSPVFVMDGIEGVYPFLYNILVHGTDGSLWSWGYGWGHELLADVPLRHILDSVVYVHASDVNVYAIQADGSLWAWGLNLEGRLGDGTLAPRTYPVNISYAFSYAMGGELTDLGYSPVLSEGVDAQFAEGGSFFALHADGSLWSWGLNPMGVLGDGSPSTVPGIESTLPSTDMDRIADLEPAQIMEDVAVFYVSGYSAFAIQTDGSLWAWGDNTYGQLGDGTRISRDIPVRIMDGAVSIYVDGASTFVTRADGSLWAWGFNALGQLGDGTFVSRLSPVLISI